MIQGRPEPARLLDRAEAALVRYCLERPGAVPRADEATLRHAFTLARLEADRQGSPAEPEEYVGALLGSALALFGPKPGEEPANPEPELVAAAARRLWPLCLAARGPLSRRAGISPAALDREARQRKLALALGGGGGSGYVYLGCLELLEEWRLSPALIAGTSLGAILGLFRARRERHEGTEVDRVLGELTYRQMFRIAAAPSRYAVPAPLRLQLRSALGRHFGILPRLDELALPLVVVASGVRRGMLPRPLEAYERLFDPRGLFPPTPRALRRKAVDLVGALAELVTQPNRLAALHLGIEPGTLEMDCLDAVGFSSSLPGVIHYDVWRDDPAAHAFLERLLGPRELGWLADGGLVENCPMRAAFLGLRARLGCQNGFVLALDGFSPKLSTPAWLPLERLAHENVRRVMAFGSLYLQFDRTLSPLELVPRMAQARRAVALGRARLAPELPFLARMLEPLPPLEESRPEGAGPPA